MFSKKFLIRIGGDSKEFNKAIRKTKRSLGKFKRDLRSVKGVAAGVGISLSAALFTRAAVRASDTYRKLEGRLRLVTSSHEQLKNVQEELFKVAQDTRAEYESTVTLYARVARNAENLGLSQQQLLDITKGTNQAIQISGSSAQESAAGVIQFAQALASGELRGDEFRSVMENMPRLAEAIADGLETDIGSLRKMSKEGKLTADVVTKALLSQKAVLESEFKQLPITIGQALTQLKNDFQKSLSTADLSGFNNAINDLRILVKDPAFVKSMIDLAGGIANFTGAIASGLSDVVMFAKAIGEIAAGASGFGVEFDVLQNQIDKKEARLHTLGRSIRRTRSAARKEELFIERDRLVREVAVLDKQLVDLSSSLTSLGGAQKNGNKNVGNNVSKDSTGSILPAGDEKAFQKALTDLNRQLVTITKISREERVLWETQNGRYKDLNTSQKTALINAAKNIDTKKKEKEASEAAADAQKKHNKELDEAARVLKDQLDPFQAIRMEMETYNELLKKGKISQDEWAEATLNSHERMDDLNDKVADTSAEMSQFTVQAARNMQSAFADFLFDPFDKGLQGMADSFFKTIRRMAAEVVAQQALKSLFPNLFNNAGTTPASVNHTGGVVGQGTRRSVPLSAFIGAPRFHSGGVVGNNEVAAILQKGEEVLTARDPRHRNNRGAGMRVEIVNRGTPQAIESTQTAIDAEGMVVKVFTQDISRGGPIANQMSRTFGLQRGG